MLMVGENRAKTVGVILCVFRIITIQYLTSNMGVRSVIIMCAAGFISSATVLYIYFSIEFELFSCPTVNVVADANIMPKGNSIMAFWRLKVSSSDFPVCKLDPVIASGSK